MRKISYLLVLFVLVTLVPASGAQDEDGIQYLEGDLDTEGSVTIPLYEGTLADGGTVWFIITDVSDLDTAGALGINFSPKLALAEVTRTASGADLNSWVFDAGTVDFAPEHNVVPGDAPNFFPPAEFQPGSVGDEAYTPLVRVNDIVFNAPIVAADVPAADINFCDGTPDRSLVHDSVVNICPDNGTVMMALASGFSAGHLFLYMSTDANVDLVAALEGSTYAPAMGGADAAAEPIYIAINGHTGADNPHRQGMQTALSGEGAPLNVTASIPSIGAEDYSPLWDAHLAVWTDDAISLGYRARFVAEQQVLDFAHGGWITGPDGGDFGSSGPVINCSAVFRFG